MLETTQGIVHLKKKQLKPLLYGIRLDYIKFLRLQNLCD